MKTEIVIARDGISISIDEPRLNDKKWIDSYRVRLEVAQELNATSRVANPPYGTSPLSFIDDLADNWKGWKGEKSWRSMDGELRLVAVCDSCGHVTMTVELRPDVGPPPWTANVCVRIDAGELEGWRKKFIGFFK